MKGIYRTNFSKGEVTVIAWFFVIALGILAINYASLSKKYDKTCENIAVIFDKQPFLYAADLNEFEFDLDVSMKLVRKELVIRDQDKNKELSESSIMFILKSSAFRSLYDMCYLETSFTLYEQLMHFSNLFNSINDEFQEEFQSIDSDSTVGAK
jgi:hypothetical protein